MTNGTTARQKILDLLVSQLAAINKKTIANQTGLSDTTVDLNCTELRRAGYIDTGNGGWWATIYGREQHSIDPNIGAFHVKQAEVERRENWAKLLGPEVINSRLGRSILQDVPKELLEAMLPYSRFWVLCWLMGEGISVEFDDKVPELESDAVVDRTYEMLTKLAREITQEIES